MVGQRDLAELLPNLCRDVGMDERPIRCNVFLHKGTLSDRCGRIRFLTVAKSLNEARQQVAQDLDEQVRRNADAIVEDHPHWATPVDRKALPCAGRGIGGAIHGSQPGHSLFDDE